MKVVEIVKAYAESIEAKYSSYDETKAAVIVPIGQHRHQTVLAELRNINGVPYISLTSKISNKEAIKDKDIYERQKNLLFGKLVIEKDYLEIRAYLENTMSHDLIKEVFNEIAAFADIYEKKYTGKDIF
ncbi:MAG: hypothetical protein KDC58_09510 [Cyclobacteriaceae bacterium]|nr:hypothetical protein [Cyclobacteriaceae bacterium]